MSHGEQSYLSNCQRGYNRCSTRRTANVGPNGPPTDTLGSARFLPREALPPGSRGMHAMRHANLENCAILAILERRESLSPKDLCFPTIARRWKSLARNPRRPIEPRRSLVAPSGFSNLPGVLDRFSARSARPPDCATPASSPPMHAAHPGYRSEPDRSTRTR